MKNYIFAIVFVCLATSGYGAKPEQIPVSYTHLTLPTKA